MASLAHQEADMDGQLYMFVQAKKAREQRKQHERERERERETRDTKKQQQASGESLR